MAAQATNVVSLQGKAWAKAEDGSLRELKAGDVIAADEQLVTEAGSQIQLDFGDGKLVSLSGAHEVGMSPEMWPETATANASVLEAQFDAILASLDDNEALLQESQISDILASLDANDDLLQDGRFEAILAALDENDAALQQVQIQDILASLDANDSALLESRFDDILQSLAQNDRDLNPSEFDVILAGLEQNDQLLNGLEVASADDLLNSDGDLLDLLQDAPAAGGAGTGGGHDFVRLDRIELPTEGQTYNFAGGFTGNPGSVEFSTNQSRALDDDVTPGDEGDPDIEDTVIVSLAGPASVIEGEITAAYTVTLSEPVPAGNSVTVNLSYTYISASGEDIVEVSSVTVTGGNNTATFTLDTLDDFLAEGVEDFAVALGSVTDTDNSFETIAIDDNNGSVTTTITDQTGSDNPPAAEDTVFAVITGPANVNEGDITGDVTVSLIDENGNPVTVSNDTNVTVVFSNGTAEVGDYDATAQTVTINAGTSSATLTVPTNADSDLDDETFTASIDSVQDTGEFENIDTTTGVNGESPNHTITILDNGGTSEPEDTATVSLVGPTGVVEGETTTAYTLSVDQAAGDVSDDIVVTFTYSGVAADGSDFTGVASATISAGSNSTTFQIDTLDDALAEGAESFTVSIDSINDNGQFEAVAADAGASSVTTTITDQTGPDGTPGPEDTATVSLVGPTGVVEGETTTAYTLSVDQAAGDVSDDIVVTFTYSGVAADGSDFTGVASATISAGSNSTTFQIDTLDDALAEGAESFTVSIDSINDNGQFEAVAADAGASSVTTTITDQTGPDGTPGPEDTATVSLVGPTGVVEGETTTAYTLSVDQAAGDVSDDIVVTFTYSGVAADGSDFTGVASATISAGSNSTTFQIDTLDDALAEGAESFTVSIDSINDNGQFEAVAADAGASSVTTTITDQTGPDGTPGPEDTATVSLVGPTGVVEGETTTAYTLSVDQAAGDVSDDIVVTFTYSGVAADGSDFTGVASATISAGSNSTTFQIDTLDDALAEGAESFTVSIDSINDNGQFEAVAADAGASSVTTTITDQTGPDGTPGPEDTATVSLVGPTGVVEGETTTAYTLSVDQAAGDVSDDIVVTFTYSGVAADGSDFTGVASATISAGSNSTTFQIDTLDDALAEGAESFTVSIDSINDNGQFEAVAADAGASSVTTTITDQTGPDGTPGPEDTATVSLVGPTGVVEGETTTAYTLSVDQAAGDVSDDIVVTFTYSGVAADGSDFTGVASATISAGSNSTTFQIDTLDDALAEGAESFTVSIDSINDNGQFEAVAADAGASSVTTTITDQTGPDGTPGPEDTATVSLVGPTGVVEGETTTAYTLSVDQAAGDVSDDIVVTFTYSGVAADGSDFTGVASATISAGSNSTTFQIDTLDDALAEGAESFTVSIDSINDNGQFEAVAADAGASSVTTTITDQTGPDGTPGPEDTATVSLVGPTGVVEGETTTAYTLSVDQAAGDVSDDIVVTFTYSGVAADGSDFTGVASATISAGSNSTTFQIDTLDDALAEGAESFTVSIDSINDNGQFEAVAADAGASSVTTTITDQTGPDGTPGPEDTATVSLVGPTGVVEGETTTAYTLSVDQAAGDVSDDIVVTFTYSGVAADGSDFTGVASATISAGSNSTTFQIDTLDDALAEGAESFTVSIDSINDNGQFEAVAADAGASSVTTTITDQTGPDGTPGPEDTATVSLVGPTGVVEGETTTAYTLSVDQAAGDVSDDIVVTFTYSGVAADGSDFTGVASATISAGSNSTTFQIDTLDDALAEGAESFTVSIDSINDNGQFEAVAADAGASSVTTTITDQTGPDGTPGPEDTATVSLVGPTGVVEGETTTAYTLSVDQAAGDVSDDIVVTFTYSGVAADGSDFTGVASATISAGSNSTTFQIDTLDDALAEGAESFTVSIDSINDNGQFEAVAADAGASSVTTTITDQTGPDGTPGPEDTATVSLVGPTGVVEGETTTAYTLSVDQAAGDVSDDIVVTFTYSGVAADGSDFTGVASATISAGSNSTTFQIDTLDDALAEGAESFTVSIDSINDNGQFEAVAADAGASSVTTTITDQTGPDGTPGPEDTATVSLVGPTGVVEGETTTAYTLSVDQAAGDVSDDIVVTFTYSGVAADGSDFTGVASATISAGSNSTTFQIDTLDDALAEGAESFTVSIDSINDNGQFEAVAADAGASSVTTTITDQTGPDGTPGPEDTATVSLVGPTGVVEGETTTAYTLSVDQAAGDVSDDIVVTFTYSGVAADGSDFTGVASATISAGSNSTTFQIDTLDDALAEGAESFTVSIDSINDNGQFEAVAADAGASSVTTTITDQTGPDGTPGPEDTATVSLVGPTGVVEGETTTAYTLSVDQAAGDVSDDIVVTFTYSGVAADGSDFTGVASATISAGSNSTTFQIDTLDDALAEGAESFTVSIDSINDNGQFEAVAADAGASSVTTTITDQTGPDGTPGPEDTATVSLVGPTGVVEGETTTAYTLSVDQAAGDVSDDIVVTFTYSGVAADGSDFTGVASATISAGSNSTTFQIDTLDDALAEGAESFTVSIDSINDNGQFEAVAADAGASSVTTTITDQTGPDGTPGPEDTATVSLVGPTGVVEGETTTAYTLSVDQAAGDVSDDIVVTFTYSGVAADGSDFTGVASATISAGSNSTTFQIDTLDDALAEGAESFTVSIDSINDNGQFEAVAADAGASSVTTTITDQTGPDGTPGPEDTVYAVISGPASVNEGETTGNFTVSLIDADGNAVSVTNDTDVTVVFANGSAEVGDYDATNQTVTITAGSSSATLTVDTNEDVDFDDETFTASIDSVEDTGEFENIDTANGANGESPSHTVTIVDNDTAPTISINDVTVNEDAGTATFTVSLSNATTEAVTFDFVTSDGSATAGADYEAASGSGSIAVGATSTTITVNINDDFMLEGDETFDVTLSNLSSNVAASGNDLVGVGTITDAGSTNPPTPEVVDGADTVYAVISGPASVNEGETTGNFTVSLIDADGNAVSVTNDTDVTVVFANGTAEAGDYDVTTQVVTIASGASSATLTVDTNEDVDLDDETFTASIDSVEDTGEFENIDTANGANGENPSHTVTIVDNDSVPSTSNSAVSTQEDTYYYFSLTDFPFTDADGDSIASVTIETVPGEGTLQFFDGSNWTAVSAGQVVSQSDIADDNLRYEPLADAPVGADSGTDNGNFTFSVSDGSESSSVATMTVSVVAVADTPELTLGDVTTDVSNDSNFSLPSGNGLVMDSFTNVPTVSPTSAADADVLESALSGLIPDAQQIINQLGDGNTSGDSEFVPLDGAVRVTGLIYLEPGDYSVSGYQDDTLHIEIGGNVLHSEGHNTWGAYTSSTLTVTESGYYTFELYAYNGASTTDGWVSALMSTNGGTAQTLDNYNLFTNIQAVADAGGQYSAYSDNAGDGGYYPVRLNQGIEDTPIQLQDITASLNDLDGSETLSVVISQLPIGSVLSDGVNSFTSTSGNTEVDVTAWDLTELSITPPSGFTGQFDLNVTATATESSNADQADVTESFTVIVLPEPDVLVPDAVGDSYTVAEDAVLTGDVSTNDTPSVDTPNVYTVEAGDEPSNGVVVMNSDGTFTYTPNSDFNGSDSFVYTITDSNGDTDTATVSITVTPTSPAIDAVDDSVIVNSGASFSGSVAGNDLLGETPSGFTIDTNVANGTLVFNNDGSYTYTPSANFSGSDSFTYTITDADGQTDTATVSITVVELNDNAGTVYEEALPGGSNSASNAEVTSGNLLSDDLSLPANLSLAVSIAGGSVDNSVAGQSTITTAEGNILVVNTDNTSAGFGDYTYTLVNPLDHLLAEHDFASGTNGWTGTGVSNNSGSLQINRDSTATQTFNFDDSLGGQQVILSFTVTVSGGWETSGGAQDYFNVSDIGGVIYSASPTDGSTFVVSVPVTLNATGDVTLQLNADTTADAEIATIDDLTIALPQLTDTFTYTVTDGAGYTGSANLIIDVIDDLGDTPRDYDESISVSEDQDISVGTINLLDNALPASASQSVSGVSAVNILVNEVNANADFTITSGTPGSGEAAHYTLTYNTPSTPTAELIVYSNGDVEWQNITDNLFDFLGSGDSAQVEIEYTANIGGTSDNSTATIDVSGLNDNPVAVTDTSLTTGGFASEFWVYNEGVDGPNLESVAQVIGFTGSNTPDATFITTGFSYSTRSGDSDYSANLGTGNNLESWLADGGDEGSVVRNTTESSGDAIIRFAGVFDVATAGTYTFNVTHDDGFIVFIDGAEAFSADFITPPDDFTGDITLTAGAHDVEIYYWDQGGEYVFDGSLFDSNGVDMWTPANMAYRGAPITTEEDSAVTVSVLDNDYDVDGDSLTVISVSNGANGTVTTNGTTVTYNPNAGFFGQDSFVYTISDGNGGTDSVSVAVEVRPENNAPEIDLDGDDSSGRVDGNFVTGGALWPPIQIVDSDVSLTDIDGAQLFSATFQVLNPQSGDELIISGGSLPSGLSFSYNSASGIGVITGNASHENYEQALQLVRLNNSDQDATGDREITVRVNDGNDSSELVTSTVRVTGWQNSPTTGDDTVDTSGWGGSQSMAMRGGEGNDSLRSDDLNDFLSGGIGNDVLQGDGGNDLLIGGVGADTFAWSLGDQGSVGTPASDTITDFSLAEGDVLDLSDLLQGEESGNLTEFLHFEQSGGDTVVHISSNGGYAGGYDAGQTDQTITLEGVNLSGSDTDIINQLLTGNHLDVD